MTSGADIFYKGKTDTKGFTKSQQLRNLLYGEWSAVSERFPETPEFPDYYDKRMDEIMNALRKGEV